MQHTRSDSYLVSAPLYHSLLTSFDPKAYLQEYYTRIGEENSALLHFHANAYAYVFGEINTACMLEFGGGPTIYQLISAANYPIVIDFSDYLNSNLQELNIWLNDEQEQFLWCDFIRFVLEIEGQQSDFHAIERRKQLIRSKIRQLLHCDARVPDPLGHEYRNQYDVVSANFVLESIATEVNDWECLIDHVLSLLGVRGYLLMSAVIGAQHYRVKEHFFPVVPLTPEIVTTKLEQKNLSIILTRQIGAERREEQGYEGIFMVLAQKNAPAALP